MRRLKFKLMIITSLIGIVLIIASAIFSKFYVEPVMDNFNKGTTAVSEMENKIKTKQKSLDNLKQESMDSVTGVDRERVKSDVKLVTTYFKPIFEWSTQSDYDAAKAKATEGLGESVAKKYFNISGDVDKVKATSKMGKVSLYPVKLAGKTYVYYCVIPYDRSYTDENGNKVSTSESAVMNFSIDAEGKIDNVVGYSGKYVENIEEVNVVSEEDVSNDKSEEEKGEKTDNSNE